MVKQVVDEYTNMSDYVYDETSQMYYSPSTGYYFDAVSISYFKIQFLSLCQITFFFFFFFDES